MSKTTFYKQCRLVKKIPKGERIQVSWIPEEFARVGKVLKLREDGQWDDGWVVKEAGSNRVEHDDVPDYHDGIKSHRKATGDSEKK